LQQIDRVKKTGIDITSSLENKMKKQESVSAVSSIPPPLP